MTDKDLAKKIRGLYKSSDEVKSALETVLGKDFFSQDITERIDGWEDMLSETGLPDIPEFTELPERLRDHFRKYYRLVVMTEAYNEGEEVDIYDKDQPRHYPFFLTQGSPAAFAFSRSVYVLAFAYAGSGSRLSYHEERVSDYSGKHFISLWQEYLS